MASTLTRLPDPQPFGEGPGEIRPYTGVLESADWYGFEGFGPAYGNFWAAQPCRDIPHAWRVLMLTDTETGYPRSVRRCQSCGSQVHTVPDFPLPARGSR